MKTLIGGVVAAVLGIIGLVVWIKQFLVILAGAVPAMLLLGGALAIYLGFDELKESWKKDDTSDAPFDSPPKDGETEKMKQELDELKKENIELKKGAEPAESGDSEEAEAKEE